MCMVILALGVVACDSREAPKTPLGETTRSGSGISGNARIALDSGNALFRAKLYDAALAQYERSAGLVPAETAPLLGIMMVADVKKDKRLADATLERMKKLDPALADKEAVSSHSKVMKQHPAIENPTTLPPRHPPVDGTGQRPSAPSGTIQ
jgi:hypothetical protein